MKNAKWILPFGIALTMTLTACQSAPKLAEVQVAKPVSVETVKIETTVSYLDYIGIVQAETVKKLSFSVGGRLSGVSVKKGEYVKKGQVLATIEKQRYQIGVDASQAQLNAALSAEKKATEGLEYAKTQLDKAQKLLQEGSITQGSYDEVALQYKMALEDQKAAKSQMDQANSGLSNSKSTLTDTVLKSDFDGKVMDVLYEKGEVVAAGYPVVVIQNEDQIFTFGVTQGEYAAVKIGSEVELNIDLKKFKGKIINISSVPDETTRTYEVQVAMDQTGFPLGVVGDIRIPNGNIKGARLPLDVVLTGEYDFVYLVEDGKAVKRQIKILQVSENYVIVEGLKDNEQVVVNGLKTLENSDNVTAKQ